MWIPRHNVQVDARPECACHRIGVPCAWRCRSRCTGIEPIDHGTDRFPNHIHAVHTDDSHEFQAPFHYDFVAETTHDGRKLRLLTVVDEYTRECLTIRVERRMTANDVLWVLADLFLTYGIPEHIRSDNGPEFVAVAVRDWLADLVSRRCSSSPAHPGRTATSSRSTPSSVMSCSTVSSSTRSRRRRSSPRAGDGSTTACGRTAHWGNARGRPRRSSGRASHWRTTAPRRSHRR